MIKNYKQFNEGIKHLLVGPSKEELWKYYGYDKPFDTPKEYFDSVIKDVKIKERPHTQSSIYWEKGGKIIIQYELDTSYLYMSKELKTVFKHIFNISADELIELFSDFVGEQLNWKTFKKVYPSYLERFWNQ